MNHNTARKIAKVIAIVTVIAMVVTSFSFVFLLFGSTAVYAAETTDKTYVNAELDFMKTLMDEIKGEYKDQITYQQLVNGALKGIFDTLDPFSVYYPTEQAKNDFIDNVNGEFSGVGVSLDVIGNTCKVVAPISGGPAEKAGVKSGDVIVDVNGRNVRNLPNDIPNLLRGQAGSKVSFAVERPGHVGLIRFTITREVIKVYAVSSKMIDSEIGYIKIDSFDNDVDKEFTGAKLNLMSKGMKYLILDLRNNPGGYIIGATNIANQLIASGPIIHFEQQGKVLETVNSTGVFYKDFPMVVLMNEGSASASEILGGALQDTKQATIVGVTSYGKGTAQQVESLANGAGMKLSKYYFLTPNKTKIDKIGIIPDIEVSNMLLSEEELRVLTDKVNSYAPMIENNKPKSGDKGLNVFGAQQRLAFLGYKLNVNGIMDYQTVLAVKQYQKQSKMYSYGVLDNSTRNKLDEDVIKYVAGLVTDKSDPQLLKAIEVVKTLK
jgi:carboxyl-terminal processing protease